VRLTWEGLGDAFLVEFSKDTNPSR
jgi:hypothetical protein